MNKVSIIIPVYNAAKYLSRSLDAIIYQDYANLEIILINDGSTDNSIDICKKYANIDKRICIIDEKNHGASYARNQGLKIATGKYVLFIDADDKIEKQYINCLVKYMDIYNLDLVICGYNDINITSNIKKKCLLDIKEMQSLTGYFNNDFFFIRQFMDTPWSKIYRLKIIKENNIKFPENMKVSEDQIFNYQYYINVKKYRFINKALYNYIHNENLSLTRIRTKETLKCEIENIKLKKNFLKEGDFKFKEEILTEYILYRVIIYVFIDEKKENTYYKSKIRIKQLKNNISFSYNKLNLKRKMLVFFLKYNIFFPIYLNVKFKLLRGAKL